MYANTRELLGELLNVIFATSIIANNLNVMFVDQSS